MPDGTVVHTGEPLETSTGAAAGPEDEGELRAPLPNPDKSKMIGAEKLAEIEADEAATVQQAIERQDFHALPDYAKTIFRRMHKSALRWLDSGDGDRHAAQLKALAAGWRAIRQRYGLTPTPKRVSSIPAATKSLLAGTPAGRRGRAYVVRLTEERLADVKYEKTEQLNYPGQPGVLVTIGIGPGNHRNILSVTVPDKLVASGHGMAGAATWVKRNWHTLYRIGKGTLGGVVTVTKRRSPSTVSRPPQLRLHPPATLALRFKRFGSRETGFHADPNNATKRIAYAENYVPWEVDLQGEYATETEVEAMAHQFMKNLRNTEVKDRSRGPGEMHNRWEIDGHPAGYVVESFIARRGDEDFTPGAWVTGIEFHPDVWEKIKSGEYVGTSIGGRWATEPIFAEAAS